MKRRDSPNSPVAAEPQFSGYSARTQKPPVDYGGQLESALRTSGVTGASFAYWDGTALHSAVAGLRNSVTGDPVTPDTLMHIGSITKLLNAVLMLQLVDERRIALEAPVTTYLPELRLQDTDALARITCSMLLNHTSGIDGDVLPDYGPDQERIVDAVTRCTQLRQLHAPGGGPSYCNIGTVIAGYLTQKIRDTSWYTLVKTRIYEPLGMQHALAELTDLPRFRHSVGDLTDSATGKLVQTSRPFLSPSFAPAGATLMMTAADLLTFVRTLLNGGIGPNGVRILSAESVARMSEPTIALVQPPGRHWGLGWMILPGGVLFHSGGGPGVASLVCAHPATNCALALLTNCDSGFALRPAIVDPLLEKWTGLTENRLDHGSEEVDPTPYVGSYENNICRAEVYFRDRCLSAQMSMKAQIYDNVSAGGYPPIKLRALGNHRFEGAALMPGLPGEDFKFLQPDSSGRMQMLGCMARLLARTK